MRIDVGWVLAIAFAAAMTAAAAVSYSRALRLRDRQSRPWREVAGIVPIHCSSCGFEGETSIRWQQPDGYWAKCPDCGSTSWLADPYPGQ